MGLRLEESNDAFIEIEYHSSKKSAEDKRTETESINRSNGPHYQILAGELTS